MIRNTILFVLPAVIPAYHTGTLGVASAPARARPPRAAAIEPIDPISHNRFLSEVAMVMPPPALGSVMGILTSRGETIVEPSDRSLHPLLIPLTKDPSSGQITSLLRWPAAGGGGSKMPVVRTTECGRQLALLADSADAFVAREAAVADAAGSAEAAALAELSAKVGFPYSTGDAAKGAGGLSGYLITKIGPFMSAYEELADGHFTKGSDTAGLITCERCEGCFGAWGRPLAFHSRKLSTMSRDEEARDKARSALDMPLWTLGDDLDYVLSIAGTDRAALIDKLRLKADGNLTEEQLRAQNGMEKRSPQQIAKDRASYVLDLAVAAPEEYTWEGMRSELADLYEQADMKSIAAFVSA